MISSDGKGEDIGLVEELTIFSIWALFRFCMCYTLFNDICVGCIKSTFICAAHMTTNLVLVMVMLRITGEIG